MPRRKVGINKSSRVEKEKLTLKYEYANTEGHGFGSFICFSSPPYMPRHFLSASPSSTIDLLHEEYGRCGCRSLVIVGMGHVTKIELNNSLFLFNDMVIKKPRMPIYK